MIIYVCNPADNIGPTDFNRFSETNSQRNAIRTVGHFELSYSGGIIARFLVITYFSLDIL